MSGKGLGDSRQKLGWVPEHHTDFIFSDHRRGTGLIATLLVLAAFVAILALRDVYRQLRAADFSASSWAAGTTFLISLQALINIAVVTSTLPNKGLPLPFISYGGSNLVLMLTCVGLLLSIARQARAAEGMDSSGAGEEQPTNPFARRERQGATT